MRVLDPARGPGVLALHPDRPVALLDIPGLVADQYRVGVSEPVDDVAAQVIAHRVGVPFRLTQQVLQSIGES